MSNVRPSPAGVAQRAPRRAMSWLNAALFLVAMATTVVAANVISLRPQQRWQADATRTRAYSLSEQTHDLLGDLHGSWTIAIIMDEAEIEPAVRRQLDEVLRRMADAAPGLRVTRIDPGRQESLAEYEALLAALHAAYREPVARHDQAMDAAAEALQQARLLIQQQGPGLSVMQDRAVGTDGSSGELVQRINAVGLLAEGIDPILDQVRQARRVSDARPIADYDGARSILAHSFTEAATQLSELASHLNRLKFESDQGPALRQAASQMSQDLAAMAQRLAAVGDPLRHLPPLELGEIGRRLAEGEAAVVLGPDRAAVVPSDQLFPKSNLRQTAEGGVRFDQRFRGEQVLAGAIRSLLVPHMPLVVLVHAEEGSMLRRRDRQIDLLGVGTMLATAGYEVREWQVNDQNRPTPVGGQPVTWVIVPPTARTGLQPDERELRLMDITRTLLSEGQNVLLSMHPSLLPRMRQPDPWPALLEPFDLSADTAQVIVQSVRTSAQTTSVERNQIVQQFKTDHVVGRAVEGQHTLVTLPVPIRISESALSGADRVVVAQVEPGPDRWLEPDWHVEHRSGDQGVDRPRLDQPQPVVVAVERANPVDRGARRQRVMVVGSGGWMLSFVADVTVSLGGQRAALAYPGNHELMLATVAWLSGMDEFIAPGATSRQAARLYGITPAIERRWRVIALVVMPIACLGCGAVVWLVRRR